MRKPLALAIKELENGRIEVILPIELADKASIRFADMDELKKEAERKEENDDFEDFMNAHSINGEDDEECDCENCDEVNCPSHPQSEFDLSEVLKRLVAQEMKEKVDNKIEEDLEKSIGHSCNGCADYNCPAHPEFEVEEEPEEEQIARLARETKEILGDGEMNSDKADALLDLLEREATTPFLKERVEELKELQAMSRNMKQAREMVEKSVQPKASVRKVSLEDILRKELERVESEESKEDKLDTLYRNAMNSTERVTPEEYASMERAYVLAKNLEEITGIKSPQLDMLKDVLGKAKELMESQLPTSSDNRRPDGRTATRIINGKRTTGIVDRLF